jgi:uncharacterized protein (DUF2235 family)
LPDSRNIVICCDGTSNEVSTDSTNVLRLFRTLIHDETQICWYDAGVGATSDPTKLTNTERWSHRMLDMAAGASVQANARRAYRFLSETWQPGDRIWMFGFSRGAYTVRAVAGMIRFLGLTRPEHAHLDALAWTIFGAEKSMTTATRFGGGSRFGESFCWPANCQAGQAVHFVGVWDTVSSFGVVWDLRTLPYTSDNSCIAHVRHAVAIDERRAMFQPCLFHPRSPTQHVSFKERWFAGTHGDVGGGWPEPKAGLAKVTLKWMYGEAEQCDLRLDPDKQAYFLGEDSQYSKADRHFLGQPSSAEGPRSRGEKTPPNILAPVNDPFADAQFWNLLEFAPRRSWTERGKHWQGPHLWAQRELPPDAVCHPSVQLKLEQDSSYKPANLRSGIRFGD